MNNEVIVRRFIDKDIDELYEMIHLSLETDLLSKVYEKEYLDIWHSLYTKEYLLGCSKLKHLYVALLDNKVVGSGAVSIVDNKAYVSVVYINPHIQGKGIGRAIMNEIETDEYSLNCKKIFLHASLSANKFYQKLGYHYPNDVAEIIVDCGLDFVELEKTI